MTEASATSVSASMREFLSWVGARERTYEEAMEAWRTSCPRFSTWEDASIGGYIRLAQVDDDELVVSLTAEGRALIDAK